MAAKSSIEFLKESGWTIRLAPESDLFPREQADGNWSSEYQRLYSKRELNHFHGYL